MLRKDTVFRFFDQNGTILAIVLMILLIFLDSFFAGVYGAIGDDFDDVMRLVQIKDYLAGQSWFHTDQYRMGLEGGTDMHWSRLPDIPIILLTQFFDIFLSQEQSLVWAYTIWPPLSASILIFSCLLAAKNWGGERTKFFTIVLLLIFLLPFNRFLPGAIDHHNIQLGFVTLSMACALDEQLRFKSYLISGFAAAMSVAIGVEVYFFILIICAYIALNWALLGKSFAAAVQGFGVGFSITLTLLFFGTIAPSEYGLVYCDALSLITVTVGVIGALGLALLTKIDNVFAFNDNRTQRLLALCFLGLICAVVLFFQAPQCMINPLDSLPDDVSGLWLNNITEAQSILASEAKDIPFWICVPVIALIILGFNIMKHIQRSPETGLGVSSISISGKILAFLLLSSALILTLYQVRFYPFAHIFAIVPMAVWVNDIYVKTKLKKPNSVVYLAALVVSAPVFWLLISDFLPQKTETIEEVGNISKACSTMGLSENLNSLAEGVVLANSDMTPFILEKTLHRVVSGNYHRNWKGIAAEIQIFISEPVKSEELIRKNNVDYLYYCATSKANLLYTNHSKVGLAAQLSQGNIPEYLEIMPLRETEDSSYIIFKVKPFNGNI